MYVIQARDLISGTCGSPILAPSIEIAKRQIGRMIAEHPVLKDKPDGAELDIICFWDPEDGMIDYHDALQRFSGSECLAAFQHALDVVNTPGEGEWTADDGVEEAK